MKKFDPNNDDPATWRNQLADWRQRQKAAALEQQQAGAALKAAQARFTTLDKWVTRLTGIAATAANHATDAAATAALRAAVTADLADTTALMGDHRTAREVATARALNTPATSQPLVLLPLRLQTKWAGTTLTVRIYPSDLSVDRHDPRLTDAEQAHARTYWETSAVAQPHQDTQAWQDLVGKVGGPRAAWIVTATAPTAAHPPARRDSPWDLTVAARLLPDRFAVVAYHAGEPINMAAAGQPPRYVTWGAPLPDPVSVSALHQAGDQPWTTDVTAAVTAGMAVQIPVPTTAPAIDELVVVGVRTHPGSLADLLDAHAFSTGLEILADRTPTNNSSQIRAAHSPGRDEQVAAALIASDRPTTCPDGTAGAQLADLLGIARPRVAAIAGATTDRHTLPHAINAILAAATVHGPVLDQLTADTVTAAWPLISPGGPGPTLRIGRQPYGLLPATAPARWQPRDGDPSNPLTGLLSAWAAAHLPPVDVDPDNPPPAPTPPRHVTRSDESALPTLLLEAASSLAWTADPTSYTGLDGLVGPSDGPQSPGQYLARLADATAATLPAVTAGLPDTLLARLALAAKRRTPPAGASGLTQQLHDLAEHAARDGGRDDLAQALTEHLDALSHRTDAWVTAAATARLHAQRGTNAASSAAIGAYGYLTDVAPRTDPRTYGHVHAPSLAHAATAAVLRSGYLGQRRAAWGDRVLTAAAAEQRAHADLDAWAGTPEGRAGQPPPTPLVQAVEAAQHATAAARAGLAQLSALDASAEANLPLAIDLSSRRVRQARGILRAVRQGQPLAAVLGYLLERDLTDTGLQRYITPLRKLTRFHTGTALENLEKAREEAQNNLTAAHAVLDGKRTAVKQADDPIAQAAAALAAAQTAQRAAELAAQPYQNLRAELATLEKTIIPQAEAALGAAAAPRPQPGTEHRTIDVPD